MKDGSPRIISTPHLNRRVFAGEIRLHNMIALQKNPAGSLCS
jgi:hypothetical protein